MALKFAPWSSEIELPFYTALTTLKIDYDKLNDGAKTIQGLYELRSEVKPEDSCRMRLLGNAFTSHDVPINHVRAEGKIKNMNTIEDFQNSDKSALLRNAGKQIWDAIDDGTIYQIPSLLASFYVVSFANLKKYNFTYWFAFPALHSDPAWKQVKPVSKLSPEETVTLVESFNTLRFSARRGEHGFFLAKRVWSVARPATPEPATPEEENRPRTPQLSDVLGFEWVCGSIKDFEEGFFNGVAFEDQFVCFIDPSTYEENPGWMLRNYLVLIRRRWKLSKVQILCYRDIHSSRHIPRSLILSLELPEDAPSPESMVMPKVTGWERNPIGKLLPRTTNLSTYMDPRYLADQAVDLNLKLMKWRIVPDLNLDVIKNTKCLLLGAGTLGTFVSRSLMAWGVRKITFVDNATVSFSNPVRQPLFEFEDCLNGGAKKAEQAAAALRKVYPGVNSAGHAMSVPMLGHAITSEATTKADFERLQQLIEEHDAIFLLMDTRESRWLPTLMGKAAGKIVMNAALGFDTYVVMRHGVSPPDGGPAALGCYFCNDVVAPADSVKDQTLDQQCTVTRPGVAPMASSLLVELLVSILQHPQGAHAAAPKPQTPNSTDYERDPPSHVLGLVPHQIRGYLATFSNMLISGQSYDCCSACSSKVVEAYRQDGWDFIKRALTEKDYVTELSGLAEVQRQAEAAAGDVEWDSEDELADDGEGEGELL